jgi:hypothetical protein
MFKAEFAVSSSPLTRHILTIDTLQKQIGSDEYDFGMVGAEQGSSDFDLDAQLETIDKIKANTKARFSQIKKEYSCLEHDTDSMAPSIFERLNLELGLISSNNQQLYDRVCFAFKNQQLVLGTLKAWPKGGLNYDDLEGRISCITENGCEGSIQSIKVMENLLNAAKLQKETLEQLEPVVPISSSSSSSSSSSALIYETENEPGMETGGEEEPNGEDRQDYSDQISAYIKKVDSTDDDFLNQEQTEELQKLLPKGGYASLREYDGIQEGDNDSQLTKESAIECLESLLDQT